MSDSSSIIKNGHRYLLSVSGCEESCVWSSEAHWYSEPYSGESEGEDRRVEKRLARLDRGRKGKKDKINGIEEKLNVGKGASEFVRYDTEK